MRRRVGDKPFGRQDRRQDVAPSAAADQDLPAAIVRALHEGTVKALRSKEVSGKLANEAAEVVANTPQEFAAFLKAESDKWTGVIRKAKVKLAE